eukprot:m.122960 g.122960  ORF g.122960 m.122960 type:complete len:312 (-) comp52136_c0_seq6:54-989(-)
MKKTFWSFLLSERLDSAGEMVQSAAVVASTGFDGTVQIHSKMAHHVLNLKFPTSLAIDPSCTMLAVCHSEGVNVYNLASYAIICRIETKCFSVHFLQQLQPLLVCGSIDGDIIVFHVLQNREIRRSRPHIEAVKCFFESKSGDLLVSASNDTTISVQRTADLSLVATLVGHQHLINAVLLLDDENTLISASDDKTIRVWDVRLNKCTRTIAAHSSWVAGLALASDNRIMASASEDGSVIIWDLSTKVPSELHRLTFSSGVLSVVFTPESDDSIFVGVRDLGVVQRLHSSHVSQTGDVISSHRGPVLGLAAL